MSVAELVRSKLQLETDQADQVLDLEQARIRLVMAVDALVCGSVAAGQGEEICVLLQMDLMAMAETVDDGAHYDQVRFS